MKRTTTGRNLSPDEAFRRLLDYGLFTEMLPPCFTSRGLSQHIPADHLRILTEPTDDGLKQLLKDKHHDFIRYELLSDASIPRQFGIPHPESYLLQSLVLKRYWPTIKKHCAKPSTPFSRTFVRQMQGPRVFKMNYDGFDRQEIEETDIRNMTGARYVAHADISTCFPSIYTHSIPWALHGRNKAKKDYSLELTGNLLDKVSQGLRDRQTNGLLIGPHTSNVISEVILTDIDVRLAKKCYTRVARHIDDYRFYATTQSEAEQFIRDLGILLREYELSLNQRKTKIVSMPRPVREDWIRELHSFPWPHTGAAVGFTKVQEFLDLALDRARESGAYRVLNYAIKMVPHNLDDHARHLFVQHAVNLALLHPYLAPILNRSVFEKHRFSGIEVIIDRFANELLSIGVQRVYTDAISYALYYSLKYGLSLSKSEDELCQIIPIDDCLSNVLLLEYAKSKQLSSVQTKIWNRAAELRKYDRRDQDRFWLLIYQVSRASTLDKLKQSFLANLKRRGFEFVRI